VKYANGSAVSLSGTYGNANVAAYLPTYSGNISAGNISVSNVVNIINNLNVKTGTFTGDATGDNSIYAGFPTFTVLGSDVVAQFSGNTDAYIQFNFQNGNTGNQASGDYVITADNGDDTTHFLNIGLTGGNWDGTQPNSLNSRLLPNDGYMYVQDGNLAIGVKDGNITSWIWRFDITGSVTADGNLIPSANGNYSLGNSTNYWANLWVGNITTSNTSVSGNITGNYFIGNGSQLTDINAVTVDVTDTNGLTTIYYPTFVANRANVQIVRADVDFTYRTDDNALTVGTLVTPPVPLANLTAVSGARAFASDGNLVAAGNFGANVAGGGGNVVPVWSDGSNWYIG
jgi:hypothetical protein